MKSARLIAKAGLVAALFTLAGAASAQSITAGKTLSVTATLTSKCQVATAGAITMAFGTYVAFVGPATAPTQTVNFQCTRGLSAAPTFSWDTSNGSATGEGVLAGLRYSLTATNGTAVPGTAPDLTVANDIGTATVRPVTIDGTMPAGQAGTDSSGQQSHVRTLTVTF